MINYANLVQEITERVVDLEIKYVKNIAASVLGVSIDSWGDVKSVNPVLIEEISKVPTVQTVIKQSRIHIAAEVCKPLPKKTLNGIAHRIKDKLLENLEEEIYKELYDTLRAEISSVVREKITSDPKLLPYFVAGRLKGIVHGKHDETSC